MCELHFSHLGIGIEKINYNHPLNFKESNNIKLLFIENGLVVFKYLSPLNSYKLKWVKI